MNRRGKSGTLIGAMVAVALTLTGCATEYHGFDSGIDGVIWRQIDLLESQLSVEIFEPSTFGPADYLASLPGSRWDGSISSARSLDLDRGGVVLYKMATTVRSAKVSVFITSGPRPNVPTDEGGRYDGPGTVYTCYGFRTDFVSGQQSRTSRTIYSKCPHALTDQLPEDAVFASGEVFDG